MKVFLAVVGIVLSLGLVFAEDNVTFHERCGYESCPRPKDNVLNVHIVAHSHDDVGWIRTVDQYYYEQVQYIYDTVFQEIQINPHRRFIFVETAYFYRWWRQQSNTVKFMFTNLVREGRIEFISGGWSMSDEACTHYSSTIDSMTLGFKLLKDLFGECGIPKIGWQIDPFGHSREYVSMLAQMHMDGMFFGRMDYQDKTNRQNGRTMEFIWKASANLGRSGELFTGVLPNNYSPPPGFCFDVFCNDDPIKDDPRLQEFNVEQKVNDFVKYVLEQAKFYPTNNIQITMGNDFNYRSAINWFKNLDKLIEYVNVLNGTEVNVFYSTPSCYLKAVHDSNANFTSITDDLFPYASDPHAYWTGYYASRPALKGMERQANNLLQAVKQAGVLARLESRSLENLDILRESMGVLQHHDAITGTAKQLVTYDYQLRLDNGVTRGQEYLNDAYKKLLPRNTGGDSPDQVFCKFLNESSCPVTEDTKPVAVTIYNPIARPLLTYVRVPVTSKAVSVFDSQGEDVPAELVQIPNGVLHLPGRQSKATQETVFRAELPPAGFATYFLQSSQGKYTTEAVLGTPRYAADVILKGKTVSATIDGTTGHLKQVTHGSLTLNVTQSFYYYLGMAGNNSKFEYRASGAYIFRPNGSTPIEVAKTVNTTYVMGASVQEVHQTFTSWLTQVIRVYSEEDYIEFDWVVGPIPIDDHQGKEIITRFDTDLKTSPKFYTDSNGREVLERILNHRNTWNANIQEPVAGNYYPVNSKLSIKDTERKVQMSVLTDRSQGGSSLKDGSLELMIHRRLLYDDAFGVGEALNETGVDGKGLVVRGKHYLLVNTLDNAARADRELAQKLYVAPIVSFSQPAEQVTEYITKYVTWYSGVADALPPNVHLLSLEQFGEREILLRLEHFYEIQDNAGGLSLPVNVTLQNVFAHNRVAGVRETTLGANRILGESKRLRFDVRGEDNIPSEKDYPPVKGPDFVVSLKPMQIRTFLIEFFH